jgi:hypothetical protein
LEMPVWGPTCILVPSEGTAPAQLVKLYLRPCSAYSTATPR